MKNFLLLSLSILLINTVNAQETKRIPQFSNEKVAVWQTIIYPSKQQILKMHRHDEDRVVVALTDGVLKIRNDKGEENRIVLKKDQSYYLPKDKPNEMHSDENVSGKPIKVIVVNLKS